jgi:hypothetical protein
LSSLDALDSLEFLWVPSGSLGSLNSLSTLILCSFIVISESLYWFLSSEFMELGHVSMEHSLY